MNATAICTQGRYTHAGKAEFAASFEWSDLDPQRRRGPTLVPSVAPTPCAHPGCYELTPGARCEEHAREPDERYEARRGSFRKRGYTRRRWDNRIRPQHLGREPFCRLCHGEGRAGVKGTVVDHVIPHRGEDWLFELPANLQTLCKRHHAGKSGREAHLDLDSLWPLEPTEEQKARWAKPFRSVLEDGIGGTWDPAPRLAELAFWAHQVGVHLTMAAVLPVVRNVDRVAVEAMQSRVPGGIDFFQGALSGAGGPALLVREPISSKSVE